MFDPVFEIVQLDAARDQLARLVGRLAPGTPEFQAAFSAHEALIRARGVITSSPRLLTERQGSLLRTDPHPRPSQ